MKRIKRLASKAPLTFSLAMTVAFILMLIITVLPANRWPPESPGWYTANAIGRALAIAITLWLVHGLGWLRPAALTRPGSWPAWLLALLTLAYLAGASTYAMSGEPNLSFAGQTLPGSAAVFIMVHALFEEIVFRGLIMVALVNAWGTTKRGLIKSVVVSSLFFAGMHIINVVGGNPLPVVLLQSAGAFFLGILFCSLVLRGGSLYPAVLLHGMANLAGYLILSAHPAADSNPSAWLLQSLLMIPLALIGLYILRAMARRSRVPGAALSMTTFGGER